MEYITFIARAFYGGNKHISFIGVICCFACLIAVAVSKCPQCSEELKESVRSHCEERARWPSDLSVSKCPQCSEELKESVRSHCEERARILAEVDHPKQDNQVVCGVWESLLECVAKNVPACLETWGDDTKSYTMSPWACAIDKEHMLEFQNYVLIGCNGQADAAKNIDQSNVAVKPIAVESKYSVNTTSNNSTSSANAFHESSAIRLSFLQYLLVWSGLLLL